MRPSLILLTILLSLLLIDSGLYFHIQSNRSVDQQFQHIRAITTAAIGLTDLCVSTEARYTRHPAVSDSLAPFMDHPGAIEHFPSGSFWIPPTRQSPEEQ